GRLVYKGEDLTSVDLPENRLRIPALDLGNLVFVPDANYNGPAQFDYKVEDAGAEGANVSQTAGTLSIQVNAVADTPVVEPVTLTMEEDGEYSFEPASFGFSDVDGDTLEYIIITSLPTSGRLMHGDTTLT